MASCSDVQLFGIQLDHNQLAQNQWGKVELCALGEGLQQLKISHIACNASLSLYGGHVLSWQPTGEKEVFWLSDDSLYQQGKAIRGGIPLCWPWFGAFQSGDGKIGGNHGFARQVLWQVDHVLIGEYNVEIVISWQGKQQHDLWPHHAKVVQRLVLGEEFEQSLTIENLSSQSFEFTGALHSYFAVGHPENVQIDQLNKSRFDCKITGLTEQQDILENCVGPIDRIYNNHETMEVIDTGLARKIVIEPQQTEQWVLWNPGKEIAQSMKDIHLDGENQFVCLEAACTKWQRIEPTSKQTISQRISVHALS